MFVALGSGAYSAAMFHVTTHAFFKALLFLGAGSVIHAFGGEQDIRKMGGLKGVTKTTYVTFLIGTLAIAGIPPFSGFVSKDAILMAAFQEHPRALCGHLVRAMLTVFYMFRLLFLTFFGTYRGTAHPHESPKVMTVPLMVLAVLSVVGGLLNLPHLVRRARVDEALPRHRLGGHQSSETPDLSASTEWILMAMTVA
jgi:NADH-quinone oxidoreductase subunit L